MTYGRNTKPKKHLVFRYLSMSISREYVLFQSVIFPFFVLLIQKHQHYAQKVYFCDVFEKKCKINESDDAALIGKKVLELEHKYFSQVIENYIFKEF